MTKEEARERMHDDGLTYGDAVMLVASSIPEGQSKVWALSSQEQSKKWMLEQLEWYRKQLGTSNFNLNWLHGALDLGRQILQEFG